MDNSGIWISDPSREVKITEVKRTNGLMLFLNLFRIFYILYSIFLSFLNSSQSTLLIKSGNLSKLQDLVV